MAAAVEGVEEATVENVEVTAVIEEAGEAGTLIVDPRVETHDLHRRECKYPTCISTH